MIPHPKSPFGPVARLLQGWFFLWTANRGFQRFFSSTIHSPLFHHQVLIIEREDLVHNFLTFINIGSIRPLAPLSAHHHCWFSTNQPWCCILKLHTTTVPWWTQPIELLSLFSTALLKPFFSSLLEVLRVCANGGGANRLYDSTIGTMNGRLCQMTTTSFPIRFSCTVRASPPVLKNVCLKKYHCTMIGRPVIKFTSAKMATTAPPVLCLKLPASLFHDFIGAHCCQKNHSSAYILSWRHAYSCCFTEVVELLHITWTLITMLSSSNSQLSAFWFVQIMQHSDVLAAHLKVRGRWGWRACKTNLKRIFWQLLRGANPVQNFYSSQLCSKWNQFEQSKAFS
jgi:hypothetical protein